MSSVGVLESSVERGLRNALKKLDRRVLCLKFVSPGFNGVPDRMVILPGGRIVFVELKRPKEKERALQLYVQEVMRGLGCTVFSSVDNADRVDEVVAYCREVLSDGDGV